MSTTTTVAVATVAVSVANLAFLGINAWRTRVHDRRILTERRTQLRIENAYAKFVGLMDHLSNQMMSMLDGVPIGPEDRLSAIEVSEQVGLIKLFGSDDVGREADRWGDVYHECVDARKTGRDILARSKVTELREQEKAVLAAMRKELR